MAIHFPERKYFFGMKQHKYGTYNKRGKCCLWNIGEQGGQKQQSQNHAQACNDTGNARFCACSEIDCSARKWTAYRVALEKGAYEIG